MATDHTPRFVLSAVAVAVALWVLAALFVPDPTVLSGWPGLLVALAAAVGGYAVARRASDAS